MGREWSVDRGIIAEVAVYTDTETIGSTGRRGERGGERVWEREMGREMGMEGVGEVYRGGHWSVEQQ